MAPATTRSLLTALMLAALAIAAPAVGQAEEKASSDSKYASDEKVGIDEKLGETIPAGLMFKDEDGNDVELRSLITKPTVLTLVYFRCPSICGPLMREVRNTVEEVDLVPGVDYNLITVSFDVREGPELAKTGKGNFLAEMEKKIDPDSWRFLTSDEANIEKLTDAVGFRFRKDDKGQDFVHAGTVIFVTKDGKIVRYLGGMAMLPFDMTMAINDAAEGTPRSLIARVQKICYSYDPESRKYVFQVNKIILYVSLLGLGIFLGFLLLKRKKAPAEPQSTEPPSGEAPAGGHA